MQPLVPQTPQQKATSALPQGTSQGLTNIIPGVNVGNALAQLGSYFGLTPTKDYDIFDNLTVSDRAGQTVANPFQSGFGTVSSGVTPTATASVDSPYFDQNNYAISDNYGNGSGSSGGSGGTSSTTGSNGYTSGDIAALQQNAALLNTLLGRIDTGKAQGQETINNQYDQQLANSNLDKERQLGVYGDQVTAQKTGRENQLGQINQNANVGINSLRNIIGRSSGSGSSVYQNLLPYLVGNSMSSDRRQVMNNTGTNLQNIDKAKNQYEADFAGVLQDLMNQKKQNEQNLNTGIEGQRQGYLGQQISNAAQLSQAQGGGYDQVKSAIAPIQGQYDQSLNNVDSFFNQFKPTYTPNQKAAPTAEIGTYSVDRANVNAATDPNSGVDQTNPYAALLRKKLTGQA